MKNVLVINYSQSGQLDDILENFLLPFQQFEIERVKIEPAVAYPFPWTFDIFFGIMPDTVKENPIKLAPYTLKREKYDLIIIGYQPWFLSPCQPITALLKDPEFTKVLKDTPVATVIGSRNMWLKSQESVVRWIKEAGGNMVANIPFVDRVQNHISALTIVHWMKKGKKTRKWGFLPLPGISQKDIIEASKYGAPLAKALENGNFAKVQKEIISKGGISVKSTLMLVESRGKRIFKVWADLIEKKGTTEKKRRFWVKAFDFYLVTALFVVSPPILILHLLLKPLFYFSIRKKQKQYLYLGIN